MSLLKRLLAAWSADVAEHDGQIGKALRIREAAGLDYQAAKCLSRILPEWSVRPVLIDTACELFELQHRVAGARAVGVPENMVTRYLQDLRDIANFLWDQAEMIVVAEGKARRANSPGVTRKLQQRIEGVLTGRLANIYQGLKAIQADVDELTAETIVLDTVGGAMTPQNLARVERQLKSLKTLTRATTKEMADMLDEDAI